MAARPTARFLLLTSLALVFILFVFVFRLYTPLTPQARAPGPLDKLGANVAVNEDMLAGESFMPKLGNETAKAELGRSTWKLLHTMMARYPEEPTDEQAESLRSGECASHFQQLLQKFPPQVSSRSIAAGWACHMHNEVNKSLDKELFDCNDIGDFYDCGCAGDEDDGKKSASEDSEVLTNAVEVHPEP